MIYALRIAHSPARLLAPVYESSVPVLLICGEDEARVAKRRTPYALRHFTGASRFEELPELNHSLLHAADRRVIGDMIVGYLGELFTSASPLETRPPESPGQLQRQALPRE